MSLKLLIVISISLIIKIKFIEPSPRNSICFDFKSASNNRHSQYATRTSYFSVNKSQNNWDSFLNETSECSKEIVWFISRHGTRYPIGEDYKSLDGLPKLVTEIEQNFLSGLGCLTQDEVDKYTGWIPVYELKDKGQLHSQGADELFKIGKHWKELFPNIFSSPYNSEKVKIQFTVSNRTSQSAYHFLRGMYGEDAVGKIYLPQPANPDLKLRFHKICAAWLNNVYRHEDTYAERHLFEKTDIFESTLHVISARLGFKIPLNKKYLSAMYDECRYETAWYPDIDSIWCKPFSELDTKVMEFYQDLKYYYEDSYGTEMNIGMACETMKDLLNKLSSGLSNKPEERQSSLYFSHDKAMLHIFSSLGLFKPSKHLKHSDFEASENRVFNTSYISPFATNLGFVLYKCEDGFKIGTLFQGMPIYMNHICSELLCDWSLFENYLRNFTSTCNFSKTCDMHDEL